MGRGRWVFVGVGLVGVLVAGVLVWRPWSAAGDPCEAALTSTDRLPDGTPLEELAERAELGILTSTAAPFGAQAAAVASPEAPRLAVGGTVLQRRARDLVGAVDARTGERLWAFEQNGIDFGSAQVGGGVVLFQQTDGSALTAVSVGIEDGRVRNCTTFAVDEPAQSATAVGVGNRSAALLRWASSRSGQLSLVDPTRGEPVWTRDVELPGPWFEYGHSAGDTIVFGAAGVDATSAWDLVTDGHSTRTPEDRRLYAFSAADGSPRWDYAHEDFSPQVVGTTADSVVVRSSWHDEAREQLRNRVAVLDARTGDELWAADLPGNGWTTYQQATLLGNVVVTEEADFLIARDLATGEQLWRIPKRVTNLEHAAVVDNDAVIPGQTFQGLEVVDLRTGESRTLFDGVSVNQVSADGTSIGIVVMLGGEPALVTYDRG